VLIVDDESELRAMLSTGLGASGYDVLQAATVREAQNILRNGAVVDIVISDVKMPGGSDGTDLAVWLYRFMPETILILTSGYFSREEAEAGPMVYGYRLPKPFRPSQVITLIEQCLDRRNREREASLRRPPWD
jgi:DNA-binding NtrC family response regulator